MASIHSKKGKTGKKTYYVVVSHRGSHKWIRAGALKDAKLLKKEIEEMEESRRIEKLGLIHRVKRIDDFFHEFADHVRLTTSTNTHKRYRAVLNSFVMFLKMFHPNLKNLAQVTPDIIESYQRKRLESIELKAAADGDKIGNHKHKRLPQPQTVNYEVSVLRSAFIWAHDRDLIPAVPTKKVKRLRPEPKKRVRIMSFEECKLFLNKARELAKEDKRLRPFFKAFTLILNTGLRSGELCNLTWDDVDLDNGLIHIRAKSGWTPKSYERSFFLNETCVKLLRSLPEDDGYIFKSFLGHQLTTDDLRRVLMKVAVSSGLEDLTRVHDLRHTFNSLMQMSGVDAGTMTRILGHKDLETTMIYTHQTEGHLRQSINRLKIK